MPDQPSRQVLDATPNRVLTFSMGLAKSIVIRTSLQSAGYGQEEHDYAWSRLQRLGMLGVVATPTKDLGVANAVRELNAWDDDNFPAIQATLGRTFPEQADFVFENLEVKHDDESVLGVETFLGRLDRLESGKDRPKASRKNDLAAIDLLAKRGYTKEERQRLAGLVTTARTVVLVEPISDDERSQVLRELYGWFTDWSAQAKRLLKKKQHLITLGLASRKKTPKAKASDKADGAQPVAPPAPAPGPAPTNGHG